MHWIVLILVLVMFWLFLREVPEGKGAPEVIALDPADSPGAITALMNVTSGRARGRLREFSGTLELTAAVAYSRLRRTLPDDTVGLMRQGEGDEVVISLVPRVAQADGAPRRPRVWLHWTLLVATLATTTWAGAMYAGADVFDSPASVLIGLPYALGLVLILGVHELGHFLAARYHGIDVTPPFFFPVPFALGTFGALIQMRSRPESRRALFDMAVAGPLAGLAIAVPVLLLGLQTSHLVPAEAGGAMQLGATQVGSSVLFAAVAKLSFGGLLETGHSVRLSALAFAGWLGLLVTAFNLLPIGQLDGGHIARALLGHRAGSRLGAVAMWSLLLLALFVWPGLLVFAIVVLLIAGRGQPPLEDVTPLTPGRVSIGVLAFLLLVLLLMPLPHTLWGTLGIHCPYL